MSGNSGWISVIRPGKRVLATISKKTKTKNGCELAVKWRSFAPNSAISRGRAVAFGMAVSVLIVFLDAAMTAENLGLLMLSMVLRVTMLAVCLIGLRRMRAMGQIGYEPGIQISSWPSGFGCRGVGRSESLSSTPRRTESFEQFWDLLDQQELAFARASVDGPKRISCCDYGFACPGNSCNELLSPRPLEFEDLTIVEEQMMAENRLEPKSRMVLHQRIANRNGQSHPIQTSKVHPQFSWICAQRMIFSRSELASGSADLSTVTTLPEGDGTVRLRFSPQIHHGQVRPSFGVANKAFFMDSSQTISKLADLTFTVRVRPGETVVIAPTSDVEDLGRLFFGEPGQETTNRGMNPR